MPGRRPKALRLFVAIDPPEDARTQLLDALRAHCDLANARTTPPEQIHMTLQFIGETEERRLDAVLESVERSASGIAPFSLTARQLIQLPERGRPRLIAGETDAPAPLLELHRRLAHRLARSARTNPADRFRPHLTLCRYKKDGPADRWPRDRTTIPINVGPWTIERVRLMSSVLRPEGAIHRELVAFPLV